MNKTAILLVGVNQKNDSRLLEAFADNWITVYADSVETAIEKFQQLHFDAVLILESVEESQIQTLKKLFISQQADLVFVLERNGPTDANSILQEIKNKQKENKPAISINDDVLKNAGLNIQIQ